MMDFDLAASRLAKDQQSALVRSRAQRAARTASTKAKRDAAAARAQAETRLKAKKFESEKRARVVGRVLREVGKIERRLGVADVGAKENGSTGAKGASDSTNHSGSTVELFEKYPLATGWRLNPTSIHGEGDKIALPPSILEELTSSSSDLDPWTGQSGRPLAFRIGILNPEYSGFPSSHKMKHLMEKVNADVTMECSETTVSEESNQDMELDDSDDEVESSWREAYLDELSHRYVSYTHGTVVEFTQEDGCVGLPEPIAMALLVPNAYSLVGNTNASAIQTKRTEDPAATKSTEQPSDGDKDMDIEEKTPGHPAYGAFDLPATEVEIIPIKFLSPGKECTFTPTASSIKNGFYALKDVKLVLEQSLIRTRATLSKGDVIRTWRRGVSFDLIVSKLAPADYAADYGVVSCVNTDLNVDIGPPEGIAEEEESGNNDRKPDNEQTLKDASGRTLADASIPADFGVTHAVHANQVELLPEPPENETTGVCIVQIRGRGSNNSGRRRFRISTATIKDLFAFASTISIAGDGHFKLVTRFPRKEFMLSSSGEKDCYKPEDTLESAGITDGQVMFMIERT